MAEKAPFKLLALILGIGGLFWGAVGYGAYTFVPFLNCFNVEADSPETACALALEHPFIQGTARHAVARQRVKLLSEKGEHQTLIDSTDELEAEGIVDIDIYTARGNAFSSLDKWSEAAEEFSKALKLRPTDEAALSSLLRNLLDSNQRGKARTFAKDFISRQSKSDLAYDWLGWIEYKDGNPHEAIRNYQIAISINPENATYFNDYGLSLDETGNYEEALKNFTRAIELNEFDEGFLNNRAELFRRQNRLAEAEADYKKSLTIYRSRDAVTGLAKSYISDGKYNIAEPLIRELLGLDPDGEQSNDLRIRSYYFQERFAEGRAAIESYRRKNPKSISVVNWTATIDDDEDQDEEALKGFKSVLAVWRDDYGLRADIGHVLLDLNKPEEAIVYFEESVKLAPQRTYPYVARAFGRVALKNWKGALADANTAITLSPRSGSAYSARAFARLGLGEEDAARKDFEMARSLSPHSWLIRKRHIEFLIASGYLHKAGEEVSAMLLANPNSYSAKKLRRKLDLSQASGTAP